MTGVSLGDAAAPASATAAEPLPGPRPDAMSSAPAAARPVPVPVPGERAVYRSSRLRATAFSLLFLILLPFFASLPAMIVMRLGGGQWDSMIGLAVLAAAFTAVMVLVLVEMLFSIRARVDIGEAALKMTLPQGRAFLPMLTYRTHTLPYSDIAAVETRREIYGGALAPVLMRGARLVLKDGRSIQLGYVNDANVDPAFPWAEIARKIAARAGLDVIDRGAVQRVVSNKMLGIRAPDGPGPTIDERMVEELNRSHARLMIGLVAALVALVGTGITLDLVAERDPVAIKAPVARPDGAAKDARGAAPKDQPQPQRK